MIVRTTFSTWRSARVVSHDVWSGLRKRRILGEGLWIIAGQVAATLFLLAGIRILTGLASPAVLGTVNLLTGFSAFLTALFCLPYLHATSRFYVDAQKASQLQQLRTIVGGILRRRVTGVATVVM